MLRKVVLLITPDILKQKIWRKENILFRELREHGAGFVIGGCDGSGGNREELSAGISQAAEADMPERGTLYITDSEECYQALRLKGGYVLPYRHERNSGADFTGAFYVVEKLEEAGYETVDMAYRRLAGLPWEILTTKRCIIRETVTEDVESFYQIYAEPDITRYMEDLYSDREEEIAYITEYQKSVYAFYGYGMWTVLTKDGTVIGRAGVSWREGFDMPELGFVIGVPWQRQGYAYEVCSAILAYAWEELGFTKVQALVMEGNEKSAALCRKLGFEREENVTLEGEEYAVYRIGAEK